MDDDEVEDLATLIIQDEFGLRGWTCAYHDVAEMLLERYCTLNWSKEDPKLDFPKNGMDVIRKFFEMSKGRRSAFIVDSRAAVVDFQDVESIPL